MCTYVAINFWQMEKFKRVRQTVWIVLRLKCRNCQQNRYEISALQCYILDCRTVFGLNYNNFYFLAQCTRCYERRHIEFYLSKPKHCHTARSGEVRSIHREVRNLRLTSWSGKVLTNLTVERCCANSILSFFASRTFVVVVAVLVAVSRHFSVGLSQVVHLLLQFRVIAGWHHFGLKETSWNRKWD